MGGNFAATQASEKPQVESSFDPSGLIVSKRTIRSYWNISQLGHPIRITSYLRVVAEMKPFFDSMKRALLGRVQRSIARETRDC